MWYRTFLTEYEPVMIDKWQAQLQAEFPGLLDPEQLRRYGRAVFELTTAVDVPLMQCNSYETLPQFADYCASRGVQLRQLLRILRIWRDELSSAMGEASILCGQTPDEEENDWRDKLLLVLNRIDEIQTELLLLHQERGQRQLAMTEQTINQLHNDRISMLGKMAASMAHEIRNPLFAIEGFLKLLRSRLTEDSLAKVERYLQIIEHEFKGLYSQITGILSFAKNNSLEELLLPCSMKEIVYHVNNLVAPRLIDDNIELEIDTQNDFVIPIQKVAIQQVLTNLINNSIDAFAECDTTPRLIRLTVWQNEQRCGLSVMDTGPGIPESIRETIFEPFVSGKSNGTGLGLSICRQILSKNNGDLSFTSRVGETVFTLSFDAGAIQSAENYAI